MAKSWRKADSQVGMCSESGRGAPRGSHPDVSVAGGGRKSPVSPTLNIKLFFFFFFGLTSPLCICHSQMLPWMSHPRISHHFLTHRHTHTLTHTLKKSWKFWGLVWFLFFPSLENLEQKDSKNFYSYICGQCWDLRKGDEWMDE